MLYVRCGKTWGDLCSYLGVIWVPDIMDTWTMLTADHNKSGETCFIVGINDFITSQLTFNQHSMFEKISTEVFSLAREYLIACLYDTARVTDERLYRAYLQVLYLALRDTAVMQLVCAHRYHNLSIKLALPTEMHENRVNYQELTLNDIWDTTDDILYVSNYNSVIDYMHSNPHTLYESLEEALTVSPITGLGLFIRDIISEYKVNSDLDRPLAILYLLAHNKIVVSSDF